MIHKKDKITSTKFERQRLLFPKEDRHAVISVLVIYPLFSLLWISSILVFKETAMAQIYEEMNGDEFDIIEEVDLGCLIQQVEIRLGRGEDPAIIFMNDCPDDPSDDPLLDDVEADSQYAVWDDWRDFLDSGISGAADVMVLIPRFSSPPTSSLQVDRILILGESHLICISELGYEIAEPVAEFSHLVYLDYSKCVTEAHF